MVSHMPQPKEYVVESSAAVKGAFPMGCGSAARARRMGPSLWPPSKLSTNAKKVTVSVLYWYEKLSSLSYG